MTLHKQWETVIGIEIHAQINSKTKLFSGASTKYGGAPNSQVALVDVALPGMLPVLNEFCIDQAVKTGLALNGKINNISAFDRKHYFYADLPQGYQISQFHKPIVGQGFLEIDLPDGNLKKIIINRIHLEQDAGKSFHDQSPKDTFIDLNRSGIALMEIVTDPDFRSAIEVGEFLKKLRNILRYLDTCDGNMEQGSLRCDANVSVRKYGAPLGIRCEIKNLNSIRNVMLAIDHEMDRQIAIISDGKAIKQETRLFDAGTGITKTLRSKEQVEDYRYFPDPDLLPVKISDEYIASIKSTLPELPDHKKKRYMEEFGLSKDNAILLSSDRDVASYFEEVAGLANPKLSANWIVAELFGRLNKTGQNLKECRVSSKHLSNLIQQIEKGVISGKIAKEIFDEMFETGIDAEKIIESKGLKQISNPDEINKLVDQVIFDHPDKVSQYKSGKDRLFGFFIGQVMKASNGKVNPKIANEILKSKLDNN